MTEKTHHDAIREYGYKIGPAEVNTNTDPADYYLEDEKETVRKLRIMKLCSILPM